MAVNIPWGSSGETAQNGHRSRHRADAARLPRDRGQNAVSLFVKKTSAQQRAYAAAYYASHRDEKRAYEASRREERRAVRAAHGAAHREERRAYAKQYRKANPQHRLRTNLRSRVWGALRGRCKAASTVELLGCTIPELRSHLESQFRPGMTWENYGPVWHVDHVRPCASFDLLDPVQQRACFHYTNLQPLFMMENLTKGALNFKFSRGLIPHRHASGNRAKEPGRSAGPAATVSGPSGDAPPSGHRDGLEMAARLPRDVGQW